MFMKMLSRIFDMESLLSKRHLKECFQGVGIRQRQPVFEDNDN